MIKNKLFILYILLILLLFFMYSKNNYEKFNNNKSNIVFLIPELKVFNQFKTLIFKIRNSPNLNYKIYYFNDYSLISKKKSKEFFKNLNLQFVDVNDIKNIVNEIKLLKPKYIFYSTPYNYKNLPKPNVMNKICKTCYIAYGYAVYNFDLVKCTVNQPNFFNNINYFFVENNVNKNEYKKYIKSNIKIITTGGIKTEYFNSKHNKKLNTVLYLPRWTKAKETTFNLYNNFLVRKFNNHDKTLIVRWHPQEKIERINKYKKIYTKNNIIFDETIEYNKIFLTCDFLITDVTSLIGEFFVTGKPIIYLGKSEYLNNFGKILNESMYNVKNKNQLNKTIDMLCRGEDHLQTKRNEIIKKYYDCYNPTEQIFKIISK